MKIISVNCMKGGVGRTTLTCHLAIALAKLKKKVMLIDLDPIANASYAFGIKSTKDTTGIVEKDGVMILPAKKANIPIRVELADSIERKQILNGSFCGINDYDYVLLDCPSYSSAQVKEALKHADEVLIPIAFDAFTIHSLEQTFLSIEEARQAGNSKLKVHGIIPIQIFEFDVPLAKGILQEIKKTTNEHIYSTIRYCKDIPDSVRHSKSVFDYAPESTGALDFMSFAKEFIQDN